MKNEWDKWRSSKDITVEATSDIEKFEMMLSKAKKAGKVKLLASFGVGAAVGTGVTGFVAYQIFKAFFSRWMFRH